MFLPHAFHKSINRHRVIFSQLRPSAQVNQGGIGAADYVILREWDSALSVAVLTVSLCNRNKQI